MNQKNNNLFLKRCLPIVILLMIAFGDTKNAVTQVTREYLPGQNNTVEMIVHIIGQVQRPGNYRVQDATNLIELLSVAGGPTEFSNLRDVSITRIESNLLASNQIQINDKTSTRIIKYNIDKYLKKDNALPPPVLKPGDVVLVPKNQWGAWRSLATIVRDISVIASAYFLYLRATND